MQCWQVLTRLGYQLCAGPYVTGSGKEQPLAQLAAFPSAPAKWRQSVEGTQGSRTDLEIADGMACGGVRLAYPSSARKSSAALV